MMSVIKIKTEVQFVLFWHFPWKSRLMNWIEFQIFPLLEIVIIWLQGKQRSSKKLTRKDMSFIFKT